MSFFSSNKTQSTLSTDSSISKDILSQVRVMGEKSHSPLMPSGAPANLPAQAPSNAAPNPVTNPFIHDEPIPQVEVATPEIQTAQPNTPLSVPASPQQSIPSPSSTQPIPTNEQHREHSSKILIIGAIIAVGLILMMGIYFYLEQTKDAQLKDKANQEAAAQLQAETKDTNTPPSEETKPDLENQAFSTTRSNYLSLDPETATRETILAQIKDIEGKIMNAHMTDPVIFQVTDQNNVPLAMSRFAYLMELGPGEDLLSTFDENFKLVLYVENGQVRKALAVTIKEGTDNPSGLLSKYELLLPATFGNLFYPSELVLPKQATFASGSYNNSVVRYANIFPEQGYSFDYILKDKNLFLGNSKDVTRKAVEVSTK